MNVYFRQFLSKRAFDQYAPILISKRNSYKSVKRPAKENLKIPVQNKDFSLATLLSQKIKLNGPLTVAEYMKEVLTNPRGGYYMKKESFGSRGDFVTSPEISQLFGDILGVWFVSEWEKLGKPKPLQIVEFGPGSGTLLSDILRVTKQVGLNKDNLTLHLIELSPTLRKVQADKLCISYSEKDNQPYCIEGETVSGCKIYWYKDFKDVPKGFSLYIAHEFFDALPINKFKKTDEGWREIMIDIDSTNETKELDKATFRYVLSREETKASKLYSNAILNQSPLDQLEISTQSISITNQIAKRVEENGGIALIVDYGHEGTKADTFRAFRDHKQTDPLKDVGTSDLTADVDFSQLRMAASDARVFGPITQKEFLEASFAKVRLELILKNATPEQKEILESGYDMLTNPTKMGDVFKFMALFPTITDEHYLKFPVRGFPLNLPK